MENCHSSHSPLRMIAWFCVWRCEPICLGSLCVGKLNLGSGRHDEAKPASPYEGLEWRRQCKRACPPLYFSAGCCTKAIREATALGRRVHLFRSEVRSGEQPSSLGLQGCVLLCGVRIPDEANRSTARQTLHRPLQAVPLSSQKAQTRESLAEQEGNRVGRRRRHEKEIPTSRLKGCSRAGWAHHFHVICTISTSDSD